MKVRVTPLFHTVFTARQNLANRRAKCFACANRIVASVADPVISPRCELCCFGCCLACYHLVANAVLTVLPAKKTCFYAGVTGLSGRRPNLCRCLWLADIPCLPFWAP